MGGRALRLQMYEIITTAGTIAMTIGAIAALVIGLERLYKRRMREVQTKAVEQMERGSKIRMLTEQALNGTGGEVLSPDQKREIELVARQKRINFNEVERIAKKEFAVDINELAPDEASAFIEALKKRS